MKTIPVIFAFLSMRKSYRYLKDAGFDGLYPGGKHQYIDIFERIYF